MVLAASSEVADEGLTSVLGGSVPQPDWDGVELRLTGFIVFGPAPESMPTSGP
jgi:hypothetical protein